MSIERRDIEQIAELARLELTQEELATLTRECREILQHFEALQQIDDRDVADDGEAGGAPPRDDSVGADPLLRPLEDLAPAWRDGFFVLPRLPALDGGATAAEPSEPDRPR